MTDIPTIAFIGLPLLASCIGVGLGYWLGSAPSDEGYWKAIAEREEKRAVNAENDRDHAEKLVAANHRKFVGAAKECNAIEEDYQEALSSNRRLTDALQCKNERLERIVEAFADQKSGTAQKAVKIALGDA